MYILIMSLSHLNTIKCHRATSVSKSSQKRNDPEVSDTNGGGKSDVFSSARVDWLIAICHSNLYDTLSPSETTLQDSSP